MIPKTMILLLEKQRKDHEEEIDYWRECWLSIEVFARPGITRNIEFLKNEIRGLQKTIELIENYNACEGIK